MDLRQGESLEEAFDRVGGEELTAIGFEDGGMAVVLAEGIEVGQVAAGAIDEEEEDLFEDLGDGLPLAALANVAKERLEQGFEVETGKVAHEQAQEAHFSNVWDRLDERTQIAVVILALAETDDQAHERDFDTVV